MRIAVWRDGSWCKERDVDSFRVIMELDNDYSVHVVEHEVEAARVAERIASREVPRE